MVDHGTQLEPGADARPIEGDTRRQIMLLLLKHGPITAPELGDRLGLSAAGVRRHLDILEGEGLAEALHRRVRNRPGTAPSRGRPAKSFRLTNLGREQFGHAYDKLGAEALGALRAVGGQEAVREFARRRIEHIFEDINPPEGGEMTGEKVENMAHELAEAFDRNGYAATVTRAGTGIQICQHHCPVSQVAAEHPELCEAEHEAISSRVGLHVQPLASIADGHGVCTTNIPLTPITHIPDERSGS